MIECNPATPRLCLYDPTGIFSAVGPFCANLCSALLPEFRTFTVDFARC